MKPQTRTHFTLSLLTAGILCASTATGRLTCRQEPSWQISRNWSGTTAVNPPRSTRIKSKAMSNSILSAIYSTGWSASLRQVKSSRAWRRNGKIKTTQSGRSICARALRSDGTPITAEDIVWSWQRLVDPKTASPYASYPGSMRIVNGTDIAEGKKSSRVAGGESHQ